MNCGRCNQPIKAGEEIAVLTPKGVGNGSGVIHWRHFLNSKYDGIRERLLMSLATEDGYHRVDDENGEESFKEWHERHEKWFNWWRVLNAV